MSQSATETAIEALNAWWRDMGVDVGEGVSAPPQHKPPQAARPASKGERVPQRKRSKRLEDWIEDARQSAAAATSLTDLKSAIEAFEGCPLRAGANKTVVYDGIEGAPIMVIGEGAGGTEDQVGLPFVGKAGKLLDKMLAAIDLSRATNVFITNVTYWRPPGNRNPEADELAVCRPFVDRMIELNAPKLIISAGGVSAKSLLNTKTGIMKLRGKLVDYTTPGGLTAPLMPTFHPAYLLRRPQDKSRAWRDLLAVKAQLDGMA
ncbi:MAG: uracil-DNA glycosylase [Pseudomonadota bacterium]